MYHMDRLHLSLVRDVLLDKLNVPLVRDVSRGQIAYTTGL